MSYEQSTVIVIEAGPIGLLAAGVHVEVIDRLEQPDRIAPRRTHDVKGALGA